MEETPLRSLQLTELGLLRSFVQICEKHGLRYYIVGGTMLGAVRHQGFIPWDDDIDVAMPRPDYERFRELAPAELPVGLRFACNRTDPEHRRLFSRLYDDSVRVHIRGNTRDISMPAWIDIFALDGMPNGRIHRLLHFWHMTFWRFWYHASFLEVNLSRPGRPLYQRALITLLRVTHLGRGLDTSRLIRRIDRLLTRYAYDACDTVISFYGTYMTREILDKRLLGNGASYPFEDLTVTGPVDYDAFLTHFYGSYLQPPKETERDVHHVDRVEHSR